MRQIDSKTSHPANGRRVLSHYFDDFAELCDYTAQRPAGCQMDGRSSTHGRAAFCGSANMEETLHLARYGWPEGRALIETITAKFENIVSSRVTRPQVAYDVAGDCVDIGRYVTGEPECMMVWDEVETHAPEKIVTVSASVSFSGAISPTQIAIYGATVCALVDGLEQAGKSVELTQCLATEVGSYQAEFFCPIKAAGEPLEIDRLAFMMAHASTLRRIYFAAMENMPAEWISAMGIAGRKGLPAKAVTGEPADIEVPHMLLTTTPEACIKWVFDELKRQGINVDGA